MQMKPGQILEISFDEFDYGGERVYMVDREIDLIVELLAFQEANRSRNLPQDDAMDEFLDKLIEAGKIHEVVPAVILAFHHDESMDVPFNNLEFTVNEVGEDEIRSIDASVISE